MSFFVGVGVKVAVILPELTNIGFDTEIFDPALTEKPEANPVPFIVTSIAVPTNPWAGLMLVILGCTSPCPCNNSSSTGQGFPCPLYVLPIMILVSVTPKLELPTLTPVTCFGTMVMTDVLSDVQEVGVCISVQV